MKKIIPSTLTMGNLLLGFMAILFISNKEYSTAAMLIGLGLFFDFIDGYSARKLNAESALGKELDSLADMVTFGVAPAMLAYFGSVHEIHFFGVFCCLIYVCCSALRLARFNISVHPSTSFIGMPMPLAATLMLFITLLNPYATAIGSLLISFLMISRLWFPSLKNIELEVKEDY
ncbi:CDP-diacylglycerol--serine O-phosphatidyltransferase [Planococcus sp. CAU13]|uniref:CDP-diacylglycerol--serine O-phosphatidyltransferase n=1 Tax=Planococcus sp. CAU13 TaxID=1541197 RepID=UPI00052FEF0B|nr:CDP-diacylglycerol--serine O-phosphatidyltransferase [Planococcus sp. CAU13]